MANVPAACARCGAVFWCPIPFGIGRFELIGNITNCPNCEGSARIADGIFEFTSRSITVLSAPGVTYDMLRALRALMIISHHQDWSGEKLKKEAEAISPAFGGLFAPTTWSPEVKAAWIAALITLIGLLITAHRTNNVVHIDPEALINAIHGVPAEQLIEKEAEPEPTIGPPRLKPRREPSPQKPDPKRRPRPSKPKRKPKRRR